MLKNSQRGTDNFERRHGTPQPARIHRGFSVLEVVISVAIIITLAVVIVPSVDLLIEKARMDLIEDQLRKIEDGITNFRNKVTTNPGMLSHLSRPIKITDSSPCGLYSAQEVNAWAGTPPTGGPYVNEIFPEDSVRIATFGTAMPALTRDPLAQGGTQRFAFIYYTITGVSTSDAVEINERIDGSADLNLATDFNRTGTILWEAPVGGFVTVKYRMLTPRNMC